MDRALRRHKGRAGTAGFTYVGLIVLVAIIGLVGAATLKVDALLRRAAAEEELLEIGAAFSAALTSYAEATPRGQPTYPPSLQDLLKDPRFPAIRRHLRKIFVDPITGKAEWGIVHAGSDTGVLAVYSLSRARPLKVANFDARFANLENREHISDWKFAALGQGVGPPAQPGQAVPPGQNAPTEAQAAPVSLFAPQRAGVQPAQAAPVPVEPPPAVEPPAVTSPPEAAGDGRNGQDEQDGREEPADEQEEKATRDESRARRDREASPASGSTR
jgi:type II secretory pathway pseudopilin PulG